LIAFTCLLISILLLVISLSTTTWLRAGYFKTGLFEECTSSKAMGTRELPPMAPRPGSCHSSSVRGKEVKAEANLDSSHSDSLCKSDEENEDISEVFSAVDSANIQPSLGGLVHND
uniref:Uncharacterized protein n=1 Tax=Romanomermis culicivorax TaxID=13658 RepID=A0A915JAA2_ROMCU